MEFRKAVESDLKNILQVYRSAAEHMNSAGIDQWDEIYPSESILKDDIDNGEMYVGVIDHNIAVVFTLNQKHDPEYKHGCWQYDPLRYSVIHRLCVNPIYQNKGIGTKTMHFLKILPL